MKHIFKSLSSLLLVVLSLSVWGQNRDITVTGKVLENKSKQPLQFVTVMVKSLQSGELITGSTTLADGSFEISVGSRDFFVEVSFIGFATQTFKKIEIKRGKADIGTVYLKENSKTLDEVVIRAEKSSVEFKLDKRVFNVGKDLSSKGASALEVLNNVPSVNVDIEGQISLRGSSGVQILINGKPSVLANDNTLGTITADMIERVEVITNPSAKYDAEGTSGIINIVIKKEERRGLNGSFSLNGGWPHNHSVGLSVNRRTEKFNLFSQLGVGYRSMPRYNENINRDLTNNTETLTDGTEYRNEQFYNIVLGTDYHINKNNVLTLTGNFTYEVEEQPSEISYQRFEEGMLTSEWKRHEETSATNPKWQYELQYKRDFDDAKDHALLFSATGRFFGKNQSSEFEPEIIQGTNSEVNQQTRTDFKEANYTFKLDYTKPFSKRFTLEAGAQYFIQDVSNDYEVSNWTDNEWVQDAGLTNVFDYDQKVLGIYSTAAYEGEKWGLKLGLRAENTDLLTYLANTGEHNNQNYTNLFPSAHASYKFTKTFSLQAGYSKRIRRPRLWDLNPFFNIRNNISIRRGNPELQPEFTDSYELTSIFVLEKISLNTSVYYRYTTDVMERISTFDGVATTVMPENIGSNKTTGVELNGKYSPLRWLTLNGDFNYNYFNREGEFEDELFDFQAGQWSSKLTAQLKLPADLDVEISGRYHSARETVQGEYEQNMSMNFGLRKKIMKGRGVINLGVRDIFATSVWEGATIQEDFYAYGKSRRGRFLTFGFSYGFGKGEAMEYSGKRRH